MTASNDNEDAPIPPAGHERRFGEVLRAELARIAQIRRNKIAAGYGQPGPQEPLAGLALSGGGIRSASFSLGVLQALANADALRRFDYLSTVSGGGYIGSAFTWFLSKTWAPEAGPRLGTGRNDHPFGRRGVGAKSGDANDRIDHIRGFGNYLRPIPELWTGSVVGLVLQNMAVIVALWFFPLAAMLALLDLVGRMLIPSGSWLVYLATPEPGADSIPLGMHLTWLWGPALAFTLLALLRVRRLPSRLRPLFPVPAPPDVVGYRHRLAQQSTLGTWLALGAVCAVIALLPETRVVLNGMVEDGQGIATGIGAGSGVIGTISTVIGIAMQRPGKAGASVWGDLPLRVGVSLLGFGLLILAAFLPEAMVQLFPASNVEEARTGVVTGIIVAALAALWLSFRLQLNHLSLHRFYRDRLMETFLPDPPKGQGGGSEPTGGKWRPAIKAEEGALASMCDEGSLGPYHLVNTNAILVGSENSLVRNRGGESFVLAPLHSGSDRTGWLPTKHLLGEAGDAPQLSLATAMAISGAAANPNAGPGGRGLMRSPLISKLMMLFNVRLAYWLPNPNGEKPRGWQGAFVGFMRRLARINDEDDRPRCGYPGGAAVLGITHREESGYLELSDGGHFENLGLYELVRRRVPLIVVVDAGQDGKYACADLANAVEKVRVDFGVAISFEEADFSLTSILPGTGMPCRIGGDEVPAPMRGWALARIDYPAVPESTRFHWVPTRSDIAKISGSAAGLPPVNPDRFSGCLLYLKPALRHDLAADLTSYRAENPEFPHQTTADQFFDELQFEAYRELGYHTAGELIAWVRSRRPDLAAPLPADRKDDPHQWLEDFLPKKVA